MCVPESSKRQRERERERKLLISNCLMAEPRERGRDVEKEKDKNVTDLTWKTAMSSRNGLSEMRTTSAAGTRYLMLSVRWSRIIMELVDTTNRTGDNCTNTMANM